MTASRTKSFLLACALLLQAADTLGQETNAPEVPPTLDEIGDAVRQVFDRVWAPQSRLAHGPQVRQAFRPAVAEARLATVQVRLEGKRVALGGVVGPDGWVLTKASTTRGALTCRLNDGRELPARVVGVDRDNDLAMLKIDATGLPSLDLNLASENKVSISSGPDEAEETALAESGSLQDGDWVATVGIGLNPEAIGVVSVGPRKIAKRRGLLGVSMDINYRGKGAKIDFVTEDGAAQRAGIAPGDVVTSVDGVNVDSSDKLRQLIGGDRSPGERTSCSPNRAEANGGKAS